MTKLTKYIVTRFIQDVFFTSKFLKENYCILTREGKTLLTKTQTILLVVIKSSYASEKLKLSKIGDKRDCILSFIIANVSKDRLIIWAIKK